MKRVFYGLVVATFAMPFLSCSNDNASPTEDAFFNINAGNQWVYKRYNYDDDIPGVYTFSGITDSVKVLDIVTLDGIPFSRVKHSLTNENDAAFHLTNYDYMRINSVGQLVGLQGSESAEETDEMLTVTETSGTIFHPGNIGNYENTLVQPIGTYFYYTSPLTSVTIEGNPYDIIPYFHQLTPNDSPVRKIQIDYEAQTGMVRSQCIAVFDGVGWEDRLVWHHLN